MGSRGADDSVVDTWLQRAKGVNAEVDRKFVHVIKHHSDLFIAIAASILVGWAIVTAHPLYVAAVLVVGAISFFVGFIESVVVGLLLIGGIALFHWPISEGLDVSGLMMEAFGFGCVAWLGYRHREEQRQQKERAKFPASVDCVIPWVVANEVRTSLAAVRFLLFPFYASNPTEELAQTTSSIVQATDELQRIENLFLKYERIQGSDGTHQVKSRSLSSRV